MTRGRVWIGGRGGHTQLGSGVIIAMLALLPLSSLAAAGRPHTGSAVVGRIRYVSEGVGDATLSSAHMTLRIGTVSLTFGTPPPGAALVSLGAARDYRHDGYDALLVGVRGADLAQRSVIVYFGGATADTIPDMSLQSPELGDLFGTVLAGLGDINGDGFGDFAVGAPAADAGRGKVYVYLGAASPSTTPALVLTGTAPGDLFGSAITGAGRLNNDTYADFAVGAPGASAGAGSVHLFAGGPILSSMPAVVLTGDTPSPYAGPAHFGAVLAGGADLDRDHHDDLVVSAPGQERGRGAVWFYRGGTGWPNTPTMRLDGAEPFSHFGAALALDSLQAAWANADLVVGTPGAARGAGRVQVFTGGLAPATSPSLEFTGAHADDRLGTSVAVHLEPGSFSGSLLMGAPFSEVQGSNGGEVRVIPIAPLLGVEATALAEVEGATLQHGQFVSARPRLQLWLPGAAAIDLAASQVTIDSVEVAAHALAPVSGHPAGTSAASAAGGIELTPQLADGEHVLRAHLVSSLHDVSGSVEVHFRVAAHLAVLSPRIWPQPARGAAHVGFMLTRPADYVFEVYDLQGRMVLQRRAAQGTPDWNEFLWDGAVQGGRASSGVFFYTLTAHYQGEVAKARGRLVVVR